ncbi:MAG: hypothetical protein ACI82O_002758 [Patiriisocius sp.]
MTLFFIIVVAVIGWLLYTLHLKKMLSQGKAGKIKIALIALGLVFLALALTGRAPALFAVLGAAMTQVMRFAPLLIRFAPSLKGIFGTGAAASGAYGSSNDSKVSTTTILMTLNHATGNINGTVLQGQFAKRELDSLSATELKTLYQYCSENDMEALRLLQTYIQRQRSSEWTDQPGHDSQSASHPSSTSMNTEEAKQVLGLEGPISRESVTAAHRSLMGQFHPDKGGSDYLATKINTAREILIKELKADKS